MKDISHSVEAAFLTLALAVILIAIGVAATLLGLGDSGQSTQIAIVLIFAGVALATALPCLGSIVGVSTVGQAGAGLLTEKPELAGKVITLTVLPGSQGLYGMVISLLFLFGFTPLITNPSAFVPLSAMQGLALFFCFVPVIFTCVTSAPYQARVCAAGMHMLAKDEKLAGRVITLAALVETYALLGFLISFFMMNTLMKAGLMVPITPLS